MNRTVYMEISSQGRVLRGLRHLSKTSNQLVFVVFHGYLSSNKIGPHRLYVKIADFLSENYGDCYRFDLSGMGESDGSIEEISFEDHVNDAKAILDEIEKNNDRMNIVIISHCIGCDVILKMLEESHKIYREIIFMTPYFTDDINVKSFFSDTQIEELKNQGYTYRKGLFAHNSFFFENTDIALFAKALSLNTNYFNIIAATKDQYIPYDYNEKIRELCANVTFNYIEEADHNFLTKQNELLCTIDRIISDINYSKG